MAPYSLCEIVAVSKETAHQNRELPYRRLLQGCQEAYRISRILSQQLCRQVKHGTEAARVYYARLYIGATVALLVAILYV